ATAKESCPICDGHETMTPPGVLAYRDRGKPDGPGWSIRCVPNKFPALERVGEVREHWDGPAVSVAGVGAHEIVVESPDHDAHLARTPSSGRASACSAKSSDASWPPVAASSPRTEGSSRSSRMRRASRSRRGSSRKSTRVRSRPSRMRTWGTRADSERRPRSNGSGARRSVLQLLHSHRTGPGARGHVPFASGDHAPPHGDCGLRTRYRVLHQSGRARGCGGHLERRDPLVSPFGGLNAVTDCLRAERVLQEPDEPHRIVREVGEAPMLKSPGGGGGGGGGMVTETSWDWIAARPPESAA